MTLLRYRRLMKQRLLHQEAAELKINPSDLSRLERRIIVPSQRMTHALEQRHGTSIGALLRELDSEALAAAV